jgi:hypothetical protein
LNTNFLQSAGLFFLPAPKSLPEIAQNKDRSELKKMSNFIVTNRDCTTSRLLRSAARYLGGQQYASAPFALTRLPCSSFPEVMRREVLDVIFTVLK